jgi:dinuclear metal center YbgI/SA1388 family protein
MKLQEFDQRMSEMLITDDLKPFLAQDPLHNGLMTRGSGEVTRVGFGVSSSQRLFEMAAEAKCDALVVHHGVPIQATNLEALSYNRMAFLIKNDIALWSAHFVGDAHPTLGNNAQILQTIGIDSHEPYIDFSNAPWGRVGNFAQPRALSEIISALKPRLSPTTLVYDFGPKEVKRVVSVSGKGGPAEMESLMRDGVDVYITGEVHEWHREYARESGITIIGGGHYHTEMFGVQAIQKEVNTWGLETTWLDLENEV